MICLGIAVREIGERKPRASGDDLHASSEEYQTTL